MTRRKLGTKELDAQVEREMLLQDARESQEELHEERLSALKAEKKRGRIGDLTPTESYDNPWWPK